MPGALQRRGPLLLQAPPLQLQTPPLLLQALPTPGSTTQNKNGTLACNKSDLYRRLCSDQADM